MSRQIIAEHYCAHLNDEVLQCVLYDSNKPGARLIGIEYIVSARIFESLPPEEKKLWHSHNYEVKSGVLTAPGMGDTAEKDLMKALIGTYGKTWHTWQVDRGDKATCPLFSSVRFAFGSAFFLGQGQLHGSCQGRHLVRFRGQRFWLSCRPAWRQIYSAGGVRHPSIDRRRPGTRDLA
jgi:hypothetical protein